MVRTVLVIVRAHEIVGVSSVSSLSKRKTAFVLILLSTSKKQSRVVAFDSSQCYGPNSRGGVPLIDVDVHMLNAVPRTADPDFGTGVGN